MKQYLRPLTLLLTIVGGINWLTVALFDLNIVNYLFGRCCSGIEKAIYIIVGLSALLSISLLQEVYGTHNNKRNNKRK